MRTPLSLTQNKFGQAGQAEAGKAGIWMRGWPRRPLPAGGEAGDDGGNAVGAFGATGAGVVAHLVRGDP